MSEEKKSGSIDEEKNNSNSIEQTMRTIVLTGFGGPKMAKVQNKSIPKPLPNEVLVRTVACGINFLDLMVRQGVIDNLPKTPFIMGFECSGEIEALGSDVTKVKKGDRVIAISEYKTWSEYLCVSEDCAFPMPTGMSFEDGACFFFSFLPAYIMLFHLANLQPDQTVLVHSAGGSVGLAVSQLCKTVKGVSLIGTSSKTKHEKIEKQFDYLIDHNSDYVQEIKKLHPEGVDVVLDSLSGDDSNKGITLLRPLGKYILYGSSNIVTGDTKSFFSFAKSWWQMDKISPIKLHDENKSISGFNLRQLMFKQNGGWFIRDVLDKLFLLYNQGKIKPVLDSAWAFEDITEAMQKLHDRKNIGKIILDPKLESKNKNEKLPESPKEKEASSPK